jgi:hypothetical protein
MALLDTQASTEQSSDETYQEMSVSH